MVSVPVAGQLIKASDAFNLVTFTPTWTNLTQGSGAVNEGWYQQIGAMIAWGVRLEFGTSPAWSASILLTLPISAFTGGGASLNMAIGSWQARFTGTTTCYAGTASTNATDGSNAKFTGAWNGTSPIANVGVGNQPFTPAVGNIFSACGVYRAA